MPALAKERVLVVDDEPQILVALEDLLSDEFTIFKTDSGEGALRVLEREQEIAVVVTDQRMPRMTGDELLARLGNASDALPILLTGFADLSAVVRAINHGRIFAYVTKPWAPEDLRLKVHKAAEYFRLAKERLAAERALRNSEQRFREQSNILNCILDSMGEGVVVANHDDEFLLFNRRGEQIMGGRPESPSASEWARARTSEIYQLDEKTPIVDANNPLVRALAAERTLNADVFVRKQGSAKSVIAVTGTPLVDDQGTRLGAIAILRDVTQQRRLEQQLLQSQKMEAVGQLAGGVAHDFNNLLAVIQSYSQLLIAEFDEADPRRDDLGEIIAAAKRAETLTRQLLAFSRLQVIQPKPLSLSNVIADLERMLRRVIGEDIDLVTELSPSLGTIKADAGQVEQIVLNLTVNARDAMPNGGRLTIEATNVNLDDQYAESHTGVLPGQYVMLAVSDTGTGMDAETRQHIFEPFFTTKEVGKGTGLGLATVYGIVQQSNGHIWVYSEVGRGTSFKIYFPRVDGTLRPKHDPQQQPLPSGSGNILLLEDDDAVRHVAARILTDRGFTVFEARKPSEARAISAKQAGNIDLLLTDVVMPEMSGPDFAEELSRSCPKLRVLYMSGYAGAAVARAGFVQRGSAYVEKPFTPASLLAKVQEVLTQNPGT